MKRSVFCLMCLLCLLLSGCRMPSPEERAARNAARTIDRIERTLNVDLSGAEVLSLTDTHGGFHGDGILSASFRLREDIAASLKYRYPTRNWRPLPVSDAVRRILYGGEENGVLYDKGPASKAGFPQSSTGSWCVYDKQSREYTDASLNAPDRVSFNFWVAWINDATGILYFIEYDT